MNLWLQLYPRAWRQRYGAEVQDLLENEPRSWRLYLDLVAGAIDAHANPQWTPETEPDEGHDTMTTFLTSCSREGYSKEASQKSALLMLGASLGTVLIYLGWTAALGDSVYSQSLIYAAFNIAIVISGLPTFLANYRRPVRYTLMTLGILASYGFFLAVTMFADRN